MQLIVLVKRIRQVLLLNHRLTGFGYALCWARVPPTTPNSQIWVGEYRYKGDYQCRLELL